MAKSERTKQKQPWWLGGAAASMAVCFTHPLDQTKYRMQVMSTKAPMLRTLYSFAVRDGIPSLWTGLSASILRQSTYSTARFGLYTILTQHLKASSSSQNPNAPLSTLTTIGAAGLAGGLAGIIGNPAEVILVRMCADGAKPPPERKNYPDALRGLARIIRDDGLATAFNRGLTATIVRSVLMNVGQIAPYTAAKQALLNNTSMQDDVKTHMLASLAAGTVATTICAPADVLKSRIQSASGGADGSSSSLAQVLARGLKQEGPLFLMKGWTPAWLRLTPHTILTFVFMEKLQDLVNFSAVSTRPVEMKL